METEIVLGLGSNLGDRNFYLNAAISLLKEKQIIENIKLSKTEQTKALLPENAPKEWDINYLNIGVYGTTNLSPEKLLARIKDIEQKLGRIDTARWAPRVIDIDILIYGDQIFKTKNFTIPHISLLERRWVLEHLAQLVPQWEYPVEGKYYGLTPKQLQNIFNKITYE